MDYQSLTLGTDGVPAAGEVATVLDEVKRQWQLGHDAQARHLLDQLVVHLQDRDKHAGSAFLAEHLEQLDNQMNANLEVEETLDEMIKVLRYGLT